MTKKKNKVMIIDGYNLFVRNYVVNPALRSDGQPIGGCYGFMKSMQKLCREIRPNAVIIAWDGSGGSKRRKATNSKYKEGRAPLKLNRNVEQDLTADEEVLNRHMQWGCIVDFLNEMPFIQILQDDVEADDIIAEVVRLPIYEDWVKIIVSTDKDFLQLCTGNVVVHQPIKKRFLTEQEVKTENGIHPNNFALARAIVGDKSDNLDGIRGAGMKTVAKNFEFLAEEKFYTLDDVFRFCREKKDEKKLYRDILNGKDVVEVNYKMMQLYVADISLSASRFIRQSIEGFEPSFSQTEFQKRILLNEFNGQTWADLVICCKRLVAESKEQVD